MIRKAEEKDLPELIRLVLLLWEEHTAEELKKIMASEEAAFFLAYEKEPQDVSQQGKEAVGFAQCQLRHDYVEGTEESPVGYLEGIFVAEGYRRRGYAKRLLAACEEWAKGRGCVEFASDCELENTESLKFHLALGFQEANRIICFAKKL